MAMLEGGLEHVNIIIDNMKEHVKRTLIPGGDKSVRTSIYRNDKTKAKEIKTEGNKCRNRWN